MGTRRFLIGPTAVGKTAIVLELARRHAIAVLSMDSMQVFRGMDVGTAKPNERERAACPHALIDLVEPWESYSVAQYLKAALEAERRCVAEGRVPIYVGGTALYLKALRHGLFDGPPANPAIRSSLEARARAEGSASLHRELRETDPAAAERIHPNDLRRVVRALEVFALTGRRISDLQEQWNERQVADGLLVGLTRSRSSLRDRVQERVQAMLAAGWVEEVRTVLERGGFSRASSVALGYPQIVRFLAGELRADQLEDEIVTATHKFLRRQATWYRSFPDIQWVDLDAFDEAEAQDAVARALELVGS